MSKRMIAAGAVVLAIGLALGSSSKTETPAPIAATATATATATVRQVTPEPTPKWTPQPTPVQAAAWTGFQDHSLEAAPEWVGLLTVLSAAAEETDLDGAREAWSDIADFADDEKRWLAANPADDCYSGLYRSWSKAIGLMAQAAEFGMDGIDTFDIDLIERSTRYLEDATASLDEAVTKIDAVNCG